MSDIGRRGNCKPIKVTRVINSSETRRGARLRHAKIL